MITLPNGMTILTKTRPVVFKPTHKPVKLRPMPRMLYGEPIGPFQPPRNVREFIRWECYTNGIEPKDVYGLSRSKHIVRIRQRAMHFGVRRLNMSLKMVGRILKRDHTTVLHGVRVVEAQQCALNN